MKRPEAPQSTMADALQEIRNFVVSVRAATDGALFLPTECDRVLGEIQTLREAINKQRHMTREWRIRMLAEQGDLLARIKDRVVETADDINDQLKRNKVEAKALEVK